MTSGVEKALILQIFNCAELESLKNKEFNYSNSADIVVSLLTNGSLIACFTKTSHASSNLNEIKKKLLY